MLIEKHRRVLRIGKLLDHQFDVGVVCRNDGRAFLFIEKFKKTFCQCAIVQDLNRLRFINQQKRVFIGFTNNSGHFFQPRRIGGKMIFDRLIVADVGHNAFQRKTFRIWDEREPKFRFES